MKNLQKSNIYRFFALFLALTLLLFAVPQVHAATEGFRIKIVAVEKDNRVLVEAVNFPANQTWDVRMGTYSNFRYDNVTVGRIDAPNGGTFQFVVQLPSVVKNTKLVSLRLDSQNDYHVYNAFYNTSRGVVPNVGLGEIFIPATDSTPTPDASCSMVSITLTSPVIMDANNYFTTTWEVKNNSSQSLEASNIDYKFINGVNMHRDSSVFDLPATVQPDQSIRLSVNMRAPNQTGIYTANWAVTRGNTVLCNLPVTIIVP